MNSLKDVYSRLVEHEKLAAAQAGGRNQPVDEQTKLAMQQASDYDLVGRVLARQVFDDLVKEATAHLPVGHGPGHKHQDGAPCNERCAEHRPGAEHAEKRASLERSILDRMARDPAYVAALVARHQRA